MNSNMHRWFGATVALLLLMMPVLLTDELSLFTSWWFSFMCWLMVIVIGVLKKPAEQTSNDKLKGQ